MAILLEVIVAAAVLFAVGAFIAGRLDGAVRWPPDAKPFPLAAGRLSAGDVAGARFSLAFRGYRMADVDVALELLAGELASRDAELDLLRGDREPPRPAGDGSAPTDDADAGSPVRPSETGCPVQLSKAAAGPPPQATGSDPGDDA